jgi:gas vesicle protein
LAVLPEGRKEADMSDRDSGPSFTIGFLIGAAVGVVIGFLYAPQPGKETREVLKEKADKAAEKAREAAEKAREAALAAEKKVEEKLHAKKEEAG